MDFIIDRLTNSIQNTISGDNFSTGVLRLTKADLKQATKKTGWNFNGKKEIDFVIQSKPLTDEERNAISVYVRNYKTKQKAKKYP